MGMTEEQDLMIEVCPATVPTDGPGKRGCEYLPHFPCPAWGLETGPRWEGPGLFTLSTEQLAAMRLEPGRGSAQGGSWNPVSDTQKTR